MTDNMKRGTVYNRFFNEEDWELVNPDNKYIMNEYIDEMRYQQKKETTIKQYINDWRIVFIYILKELDNKSILKLNKKHFKKMNMYFKTTCGMSNNRVNRLRSAVSSMLIFCEDEEEIDYDYNIMGRVKGMPKETVREIVFLEEDTIMKAKDILLERKEYQRATFLMLAYDSAGRKNELLQVLKKSFTEKEFVENMITNEVVGKRGKKFFLKYFDATMECAKLYLEQRGEDNVDSMWFKEENGIRSTITEHALYHWIIQINKIIEEITEKPCRLNVHSLRHICLDNLSTGEHYMCKKLGKVNGLSLEELQLHANHSSSDTTQSYLKNRDDEKKISMWEN